MDDVKKHVNCMATLQYTHGVLMNNVWTLGQE